MDDLFGASSSEELDAFLLNGIGEYYYKVIDAIKSIKAASQAIPENYFELIINLRNIRKQVIDFKYSILDNSMNYIDRQNFLNQVRNFEINFYARLIKEKPDIFFKLLKRTQHDFNCVDNKFYISFNYDDVCVDSPSGFMTLMIRNYIEGLGGIRNLASSSRDINQDIAKILAISFYITRSYTDHYNQSTVIEALKRLDYLKDHISIGRVFAYYLHYKNGEVGLITINSDSSGILEIIHLLTTSQGLNKYFIDFIDAVAELIPFREFKFLINQVIFGKGTLYGPTNNTTVKPIAKSLLNDYQYPEHLYSKIMTEDLVYLIGGENCLIDQEILQAQFQPEAIERAQKCFEYLQNIFMKYRDDINRVKGPLERDLTQLIKLTTTLIQNGLNITDYIKDNDFPIVVRDPKEASEKIKDLINQLKIMGLNLYFVDFKELEDASKRFRKRG